MTGNPRLGINIGSVAAYAVGVAVLLAGALLFTQYLRAAGIRLEKKEIYAPDGLMLRSLPERFPERNPRWRAVTANQVMSQEVLAELGSENYISRWFEREPQPDEQEPLRLQLHAVYYTGLIDTVPHVPERCFVGGGMVAQGTRLVDVPLDLDRFTPDIFLERELRDAGVSEDEIAERTVLTGRGIEVPNPVRLPRGVDDLRMNVTEFIDGAGQRVPLVEGAEGHGERDLPAEGEADKDEIVAPDLGAARLRRLLLRHQRRGGAYGRAGPHPRVQHHRRVRVLHESAVSGRRPGIGRRTRRRSGRHAQPDVP